MKKIILFIVFIYFSSTSYTALSAGANVSGILTGKVLNAESQAVEGALVTISSNKTGLEKTDLSDAQGGFNIKMPPGTYEVIVTKKNMISGDPINATIGLGGLTNLTLRLAVQGDTLEEVFVTATAIPLNTSQSVTGLNFSADQIVRIPVARTIESVALLAPGATVGDSAFGDDKNLVSFGGSSVAENVYYINGMNVTNFRNGLGGSSVPFEFYSDFEIKTGGYSAEFGRSTGGVINAITKHGSNEFHYGIVGYISPDDFASNSPNTHKPDGSLYDYNEKNKVSTWSTDFYASGPIIKDTLFFYAIYEPQSSEREFNSLNSPNIRREESQSDDFYGLDLLWNINDNHALNLVHFSDKRTIETDIYDDYDTDSNEHSNNLTSTSYNLRGGDNTVLRYDGSINDDFSLSMLYGINKYELTDQSSQLSNCPNVVNANPNLDLPFISGCAGEFVLADIGGDERQAFRVDAEWVVGNHRLRFGMDRETNTTSLTTVYPERGIYYRYVSLAPDSALQDGNVVPDVNGDGSDVDLIRIRFLSSGGDFETQANAFYVEDLWQVNDALELSLGIRSESFNNKNSNDDSFIKIDSQFAPRLGATYDFSHGNGDYTAYANWGRYHLPIANNTNARLSGAELFFETWYLFDGGIDAVTDVPTSIDENGIPTTQEVSPIHYFSDGSIPDTRTIVDSSIEPMYQDEFILGYKHRFDNAWSVGVNYINRQLSSTIDDVRVEQVGQYILTNPGSDITVYVENEAGELVETTLNADDIGFPEAKRKYDALELTFERAFDGLWSLQGSYTYSKSVGNTEGLVKSDNGQSDAGLTTDFDFPQLMDGAYGKLPNDRPHQLKLWGTYQLKESLRFGSILSYRSGRPQNKLGLGHPDGNPNYGQTYYTYDPESDTHTFNPRGSQGRTPSILTLDFNMVYERKLGAGDLELRLDIFNLLNANSATQVFEGYETESPGTLDDRYLLTDTYQTPRSIRLGAALRF